MPPPLWPIVAFLAGLAAPAPEAPTPGVAARIVAPQGRPSPARQADQAEVVSIAGAPWKGSHDASLVLIEYGDFQCPLCAQHFRETWPRLEREYVAAGRLRVVFRNLPVEDLHEHAMGAAQAGACAHRQGRFWEMHDRLLSNQEQLSAADLVRHGAALGLDGASFARCLAEGVDGVRADMKEAERLGLRGTPMFVLGRLVDDEHVQVLGIVKGAQPYGVFETALSAASAPRRP
jgi:protein-disulfide isomerase